MWFEVRERNERGEEECALACEVDEGEEEIVTYDMEVSKERQGKEREIEETRITDEGER